MADEKIPITVQFTYGFSFLLSMPDANIANHTQSNGHAYSGGLEMLFSNEQKHTLSIPSRGEDGKRVNIAYLVRYLCDNVMKDTRKELFTIEDGQV